MEADVSIPKKADTRMIEEESADRDVDLGGETEGSCPVNDDACEGERLTVVGGAKRSAQVA